MLAVRQKIRSLAMPIVSAGNMGYPIEAMIRPILEAALPWLELGLGLDRLSIVAHGDEAAVVAAQVFDEVKSADVAPAAPVSDGLDFDVFISYSHHNADTADAFVEMLHEVKPGLRVFVDRQQLQAGSAWQQVI